MKIDINDPRLGGLAAGVLGMFVFSVSAQSQDILFQEDFLDVPEGTPPAASGEPGEWVEASPGSSTEPLEDGTPVAIVQDENNDFGYGASNQFLRFDNARNFSLHGSWDDSAEVVTMSFDFIGRDEFNFDHRWIQLALFGDSGRAHILSLRTEEGNRSVRGVSPEPLYGENREHLRFDLIANSGWTSIEYDTPDGGTAELDWGEADLWINGELIVEGYNFVGGNDPGLSNAGFLNRLEIFGDSAATVTVDIDNFTVLEGAHVGASIHEDDDDVPVLFQDRFEEAGEDGLPTVVEDGGIWDEIDEGLQMAAPMMVVRDTENRFGYGTQNQFLRLGDAQSFALRGRLSDPDEVITYSFDLVHDQPGRNARWIHFDIYGGDGSSFGNARRAHITSLRFNEEDLQVRPFDHPVPGDRLRLDTIMNNSDTEIEYTGPDDSTHTLPAGMASLWADGEKVIMDELDDDGEVVDTHEYWNFARRDGNEGLIRGVSVVGDSATRGTLDLDNLTVFRGAHVMADISPDVSAPADGFSAWQEDVFGADAGEPFAAAGADASGDGIRNAVAYALDINPLAPNRDHANLPVRGTEFVNGEDYMSLNYVRPAGGREDVTETVEAGGEPGDWDDAEFVRIEDFGDGLERVVYRDTVPLGAEDRRFMRLVIELVE